MRDLAALMGWISLYAFGIAILNFILKYINKKYIALLPKDKSNIVKPYRKLMKYVVKYHKTVGIVAVGAMIAHLTLMTLYVRTSVSGFVAMGVMTLIAVIGLYGVLLHKKYNGPWLKAHRLLAVFLVLAIAVHLAFGA